MAFRRLDQKTLRRVIARLMRDDGILSAIRLTHGALMIKRILMRDGFNTNPANQPTASPVHGGFDCHSKSNEKPSSNALVFRPVARKAFH